MRYGPSVVYDEQFNYLIDNEKYAFKVTLFNPDDNIITLTKSSILNLKLDDNIFNPWLTGTIIIDNTDDALERFVTNPAETEFYSNVKKFKGYSTRGDGRDLLRIDIIPLEGNKQDYNEQDSDYNATVALRYIFCLEDEESLTYNETPAKKYTIVDYDMVILKERRSFFSSSDVIGDSLIVSQLSNNQRSVETGKCLKSILINSLTDENAIFKKTIAGEETTPFFEDGSSKIFYSSPAEFSSYDDIMYIYDHHVSNNTKNDFSFLKKENYTGEYTLESAHNIFNQAYNKDKKKPGSRFLENLTITGSSRESGNIINVDLKKPEQALEFGEKGDVVEYNFFNTSSKLHRECMRSHIVHSYDFKQKKFNLDIFNGNIEKAKADFTENYVSQLKGKDNAPYPNFIVNKMQKNNLNYINVFSEYGDNPQIRRSKGINKLLKNALLTNLGVEIIVKGQLFRKSGMFFSLDRAGDYIDNIFDNKLLGIYFLINVQHIFVNDNEYYNKLIGIKTYHYSDPKFTEDRL